MPRVIVLHDGYGCESGCCGHVVEIDDKQIGQFDFSHPKNRTPAVIRDYIEMIVTEQAGAEHVVDIDWDNCIVSDD